MNDHILLFLDMMSAQKGCSQNTLESYRRDLTQFFEVSKVQANSVTSDDISKFVVYLSEHAYAVKSIQRKLSAVRMFCKFLIEEKVLASNLLPDIVTPKKEHPLPKFLTEQQIETLFSAAFEKDNPSFKRTAVMIKLMFATGLRISEVVTLKLTDILHDKKQILIKGKGNKERIVFFDEAVNKLLFQYIADIRPQLTTSKTNPFLFPSDKAHEGHITRDSFFKKLKEVAVLQGMSPSKLSPHTLRHSFATNLVNHDVSLRAVQTMLGHENIATTEIYTHLSEDHIIKEVFEKHPLKDFNQ